MKSKNLIIASALLIAVSAFAQKDELKTLKKIYDKEEPSSKDVADYKAMIATAEPLVVNSNESDKVYFEFYKANIPFVQMNSEMLKPENKNNPEAATKFFNVDNIAKLAKASNTLMEFEKKAGKVVYTKEIQEDLVQFKPMLLNYAVALGNQKDFKGAASVLNSIYLLDKTDPEKLYYAASYAVNAQDYDTAIQYYNELIKLNYSGEGTAYWAKNVASGQDESFPTKADRDKFVSIKTHTNPHDEKIQSKRGEIYKNVALIYVQKGQIEEAKKAIVDARKSNPDDTSLMLTEANLYLDAKDFVTYKRIVSEILAKNPNNADLFYNLGVISYNNNEMADAEKYYNRAIEIDSKYANAYLNLAILKLEVEKPLIDKMNKLGTSAEDNKKYEILKKQREDVFRNAIPSLEKAVELAPNNEEASKTLLNVYKALEMTDKAKALKAKMGK